MLILGCILLYLIIGVIITAIVFNDIEAERFVWGAVALVWPIITMGCCVVYFFDLLGRLALIIHKFLGGRRR